MLILNFIMLKLNINILFLEMYILIKYFLNNCIDCLISQPHYGMNSENVDGPIILIALSLLLLDTTV